MLHSSPLIVAVWLLGIPWAGRGLLLIAAVRGLLLVRAVRCLPLLLLRLRAVAHVAHLRHLLRVLLHLLWELLHLLVLRHLLHAVLRHEGCRWGARGHAHTHAGRVWHERHSHPMPDHAVRRPLVVASWLEPALPPSSSSGRTVSNDQVAHGERIRKRKRRWVHVV